MLLVDFITRDPRADAARSLRARAQRACWRSMAAILRAGGYPVEVTFDADEAGLPPLAAAVLADLREAIIGFAEPPPEAAPHRPPRTPRAASSCPTPSPTRRTCSMR